MVKINNNCIICGENSSIIYDKNLKDLMFEYLKDSYTLKKCMNCGLIFVYNQPRNEVLKKHYPSEYGVYKHSKIKKENIKLLMTRLINNVYLKDNNNVIAKILLAPIFYKTLYLPKYVRNGRILDVGCGSGAKMYMLENIGWFADGVEISKSAAKIAGKINNNSRIYNSNIETMKLPNNKYDAIIFSHTLEHFKKPQYVISKVKKSIKYGGQLIISVPNADSIILKIFKKHCYLLDVPRHLFTFNKKNIEMLLENNGFKIQRRYYSQNFGSLLSAISVMMGKKYNYMSFTDKLLWIIMFFLDPLLSILNIGDYLCVHARYIEKKDNN